MEKKTNWHNLAWEEAVKILELDPGFGLTEEEVRSRQQKYGKNLITEKKKTPEIFLFLKQFKNPLIYLIFLAAILSLFLRKFFDAVFILIVVLITGTTAYIQERKVSRILEELKKVVKVKTMVIRKGRKMEINSEELVSGDIVLLKAGDKVPADGRLIKVQGLEVNEMALSGEWLPSRKHIEILPENTLIADRENMVYMGTIVENGTGIAVITAIGKETEMGKIASSLHEEKEKKMLLEQRLASFSKHYGTFVLFLVFLIFIFGMIRKIPGDEFLITIIAVGVSAVPEALLPAVTIILVIGMKRILEKRGLVRKLATLETLGSVQVILSDKTATLTEGKMRMAKILTGEEFLGKEPKNHHFALEIAALVNEAFVENPEDAIKKWRIRGGPTDKALLLSAIESGIDVEGLRKKMVKIKEWPFNPVRKYQAGLYQTKTKEKIFYLVGAPEKILESSQFLRVGNREEFLDEEKKGLVYRKLESLAEKGFRVLGLGYKKIRNSEEIESSEELANDLVFTGTLVLKDPLRQGAKRAINICREMGIKPVIISGDHLLTTKAIAEELELATEKENIIEGKELEKLNDKELSGRIEQVNVFARIDPHNKLRIAKSWQEAGRVVAMTGDGINDAPALRRADVGLALGSGTDLAKEASDLILLDDDFFTIIKAIEEGRGIFDKIKNITIYLVSNDITELFFILISVLFGFPLPLLATQILWINIVEDSLPAVALTLEEREKEVLTEKPRPKKEDVFNTPTRIWMLSIGFVTVVIELAFFLLYLRFSFCLERARTFILAVTTIETFYLAFAHRSLRHEVLRKDIFSNRHLNLAVLAGLFFLILGIYNPIFQRFLHTVSLSLVDWLFILFCVFIEATILEKIKDRLFVKRKEVLFRP